MRTEIALHIKIPYASDIVDIFNTRTSDYNGTDFNAHKGAYKTMHYVKNLDDITYFRTSNNLLTYERRTRGEIAIFIPDFLNTSYKVVQFSKLNIINKSEKNLLVKTAKDKLYFVSLDIQWDDNKRYIAVIDVKRGKPLFIISKEDETRSDLLHIIDQNIIPIIQFKKQSISIYLLDLSRDKVDVISWNIMNIRQLIINLLTLGKVPINQKKEIMKHAINYFYTRKIVYETSEEYDVRYKDGEGTSNNLYVKRVTVRFDLVVKNEKYSYDLNGVHIKLEVYGDKIVCYWDSTQAVLIVSKKLYHDQLETHEEYLHVIMQEIEDIPRMLQRSYMLPDQRGYKYISTDLYENDCYYIQQNNEGIMIKDKIHGGDEYYSEYPLYGGDKYYHGGSLYRYGNYIIIIQSNDDYYYYDSKMIIIDTEKQLIYEFVNDTLDNHCITHRFIYHYYPLHKVKKLFFLSKDLQCLMIVDMNKVEYFINLYETKNCKASDIKNAKEEYTSIKEVSIVLDIKKMIIEAIYNKHKIVIESNSIIILGHQVDKKFETLYIVARYVIQSVENIGVFILNMSSNVLQFQLSSFFIRHPQNPTVRLFNGMDNNFNFVFNIDLYKLSFDRVNIGNLDIYYNNDDAFISIKYNRAICPVMKGHYEKDKLIIESLDNLIIMKYKCDYTYDGFSSDCNSSYVLLTCDLALVRKMPVVLM